MSKMIKIYVSPKAVDYLIRGLNEYISQKLEKPGLVLDQPEELAQLIAELRTLQGLRTHRNLAKKNEVINAG